MLLKEIAAKAEKYIDQRRLKRHAEEINAFERFYRARDFENSAKYCENMLKEMGFSQVERYELPMDGVSANMDCIMPCAWDIEEGSFCRILDEDVPEEMRKIADYAEDHFSCGIWSAPTPPEGIKTELIDGRNITPETILEGKFILATQNCASLYAEGVKRGAAGILMFDGAPAAAKDFPDFRRWGNGIGITGWYHTREERHLVVYHITPKQGEYLHERLAKGSLTLHAVMKSRIFDGSISTVTGIIPGESSEEITILAHLYEPFLTDDALGPAAAVEICHALRSLAKERGKEKLKRTLRVVFSMELYGFSEYFTRKENVQRTFYAISMDGIGTFNTWNEKEKKTVNIRLTSGTAPFVSDLLFRKYFQEIDRVHTPETRGCLSDDTFPADPMIRRLYGNMPDAESGIPVNWLRTCTLPYHHNTGPMFNKADFVLANEIIMACCAVLYLIADGRKEEYKTLLPELKELAAKELQEIMEDGRKKVQEDQMKESTAQERNLYWKELEKKVLLTLNLLEENTITEKEALSAFESVGEVPEKISPPETQWEKKASLLVVKRLTAGIPTSLAKIPPAERKKRQGIADFSILLTFLDGKRDLYSAVKATAFDQKTNLFTEEAIKNLIQYLFYLEKYGYVSITEKCNEKELLS